MTGADRGSMRAADGDRDAVAERLRAALDEGRLSLTEYDERLRRAYAATTFGELDPLVADLPEPSRQVAQREDAQRREVKRRQVKRHQVKEWRDWAGVSVILTGIWLVTCIASGQLEFFWPVIPMGIWAAVNVSDLIFGTGRSKSSDD
ncbi:DUF1707 SHOCT-like domain-containing protein [Saccharopolyspora hordei]|uniref:DUF1707 domain-containing protein n=1 Tax=Saccharopolyspora hordei TaxID=1838 RepID=A0A853AGH0_9PSEU|nr:DUF1707 domain-containing protein [Saccharopolyspora hordei]NYI82189.1 hypothetical protein [Saccharopolyspora hordei]